MLVKQMILFLAATALANSNNAFLESIITVLQKADRLLDRIATTIEASCLKETEEKNETI